MNFALLDTEAMPAGTSPRRRQSTAPAPEAAAAPSVLPAKPVATAARRPAAKRHQANPALVPGGSSEAEARMASARLGDPELKPFMDDMQRRLREEPGFARQFMQ